MRHDLMVARAEFFLALPGWRDWLMAAAMLGIVLAALAGSNLSAPLAEPWVATGLGAVAGWIGLRAARWRIAHLASESLVAPAALHIPARLAYYVACLLGLAALLAVPGGLAGWSPLPWLILGLALGAAGAVALPALRLFPIVSLRRVPPGRITRAAAVTGLQARLAGEGWVAVPLGAAWLTLVAALAPPSTWMPALRLAIPAAFSAATMLFLTRIDPDCVAFLARTGQGAGRSVVDHLRAAICYALVALPLLALFAPASVAPCAAVVAGVALLTAARVLSLRIYSRRIADMVVGLGAIGAAILAAALPSLLVPLLVFAIAALYRRAARVTWLWG